MKLQSLSNTFPIASKHTQKTPHARARNVPNHHTSLRYNPPLRHTPSYRSATPRTPLVLSAQNPSIRTDTQLLFGTYLPRAVTYKAPCTALNARRLTTHRHPNPAALSPNRGDAKSEQNLAQQFVTRCDKSPRIQHFYRMKCSSRKVLCRTQTLCHNAFGFSAGSVFQTGNGRRT